MTNINTPEFRRALRNGKYEETDTGIFFPAANVTAGGAFDFEHRRGGERLPNFFLSNMVPTAGRNHITDVVLHGVVAVPTWYMALFSGNVTPANTLTAATFPATCTEFTGYSEVTRPAFVEALAANGATDNGASRAVYTVNAVGTLYGAVLVSSPTKSSTNPADVLIAAARSATARAVQIGDELAGKFTFSILESA